MNLPLKLTLLASVMALNLATPALSDSPQEPAYTITAEDFDRHIRAYLLSNPEVIIEALQVLKTQEAERAAASDLDLITTHQDALFTANLGSTVEGNPEGQNILVEFIDYQCGYCRQVHNTTRALLAADPDLRIIYKELPILGPNSLTAAKLLIATKRDLGAEFYPYLADALFAARGAVSSDNISSSLDLSSMPDDLNTTLISYLTDNFDSIQSDPSIQDALEANARLAKSLNITGTPGFVGLSGIIRGAGSSDRLNAISQPRD